MADDELPETPATAEQPAVPVVRRHALHRHGWHHRALLAFNCVVILACFASAAVLIAGHRLRNNIVVYDIDRPSAAAPTVPRPGATTVPGQTAVPGTPTTLDPEIETGALNFLITSADDNPCADDPAEFADRGGANNLRDSIMVVRVDFATRRAAILSFPRDLFVEVINGTSRQRTNINKAKQPQVMIDTIYGNFGIAVDHVIDVDFCGFKKVVDAIGGVKVPFEVPARDVSTGFDLNVLESNPSRTFTPGCYKLNGDEAVRYARSRHYEWYDAAKRVWVKDNGDDYARIARQQDFIRRVLDTAQSGDLLNPSKIKGIYDAVQKNVIIDDGLSLDTMYRFANVLKSFDAGEIRSYQVERKPSRAGSGSETDFDHPNTQAILAIFSGRASLVPADSTTTSPTPATTAPPGTTPVTAVPVTSGGSAPAVSVATTGSTTTTIVVDAEETGRRGIYPPADVRC